MRAIRDTEHKQNHPGHKQRTSNPVHPHLGKLALLRPIRRNREPRRHSRDGGENRPEEEIPRPREKLPTDPGEENPHEKPQRGTGAVDAEHEVLPRPRSVCASQDHDAGGEEGCQSQPLHGSEDEQHQPVPRESGYQRGDGQPHHPAKVEYEPAEHVSQTAEDEQGGRDHER